MATPRERHAATLLASGEVLVSGGHGIDVALEQDPFFVTASAERYDLVSGQLGAGGGAARSSASTDTATRLPSGKVLGSGGRGAGGVLGSVEVYDPASDTWTLLPPMSTPRWLHTATYVAGLRGRHRRRHEWYRSPSPLAASRSILWDRPRRALRARSTTSASGDACVAGACGSDDFGAATVVRSIARPIAPTRGRTASRTLGLVGLGLCGIRRGRRRAASTR